MAAPALHTNRFRIEVDGSPLSDAVDGNMVSAYVDNALNLPDMFVLTFRDMTRDVIDQGKFKIGSTVVVKVHDPDNEGGVKLTTGEITALEADIHTQGTFTIVRGLDKSHRLFRGRHTKSFIEMSYSDIARAVAGAANLEIAEITSSSPRHKHVTQANCTDWVFLRGLAEEIGYEMGVVDGKFVFRKPPESSSAPAEGTLQSSAPLQLTLGTGLLRCRATVSAADQVRQVQVRGWDPKRKQAVSATQSPSTKTLEIGTSPSELASTFPQSVRVATGVPFATQEEVDIAAKALGESVASSFAEMDGVVRGNPKLKAGVAVSLGLVNAPFDGKYTVGTTRHAFDPDEGYTTAFGVTGPADRTLHGLMVGGPQNYAGPAHGPIYGVVTAIVTDARDPDKIGRVKVQFPWMSDDYESDWIRTLQAGAGDQRGWAIVPEVGDEVLVSFDQGDVRRPYLLGGLYNGKDKPDDSVGGNWIDSTSGKVNIRNFTSRTGHRIDFDDTSGKEKVHLTTGDDGYLMTFDQTGSKIKVHSNGTIEIDAQSNIKISSTGGNVEISGTQVKISGNASVDVSAPMIKLN